MKRSDLRSGFTLLEVMVAVAILALSLTAIFSSEAGAIKMAARSRKIGIATLLVRCKMGEIEEQIAKDGLPAVYDSGNDNCCEDTPTEGYQCAWEIDPILLPETMFMTGEEKDPAKQKANAAAQGSTNASAAAAAAAAATQGNSALGAPGAPAAAAAALGALGAGQVPGAMPGATPGATPPADPLSSLTKVDPQQMLSGGALGGIASMAMSMVYPMLKPAFEAQIRRATVTVRWKEGSVEHSFDVTQYLVADPPAQLTAEQAQQVGQGLQQQNGIAPTQAPATAPVTQ